MAVEFKNAAPRFIARGADDKSGRTVLREEAGIPQHLGKFYIWAKKGPKEPQLLSPGDLKRMYGDETFDYIHKWFNHQTRFVNGASGEGSQVIVQRLIPSDAGVRSNVNLYMDVLETEVSNYLRYSNGDIVTDANGVKQVDPKKPKVKGYKIKFITETNKDVEPEQEGLLGTKQGTMTKRVVTYTESETETEIILVPSETEFEDKEVIVEGEFEMVEENHPTETETKLVPSDTEFDITYEDSTTDFETKMVGTGKFEDKVVRDESLDKWEDKQISDVRKMPTTEYKTKKIEFALSASLLEKYRKSLVEAGITTLNLKPATGARKDNHGLAVVATFDMLKAKHTKKLRVAEILQDFAAEDSLYKLFPNMGKPDNSVSYTQILPNLRIKNILTGDVKYMHTSTIMQGKCYKLEVDRNWCTWKETPDGFIISSTTDFSSEDSIYEVEYILINESYMSFKAISASYYITNFGYYPSTAKHQANPGFCYHLGSQVGSEAKCLEDLKSIPNPKNEINLRFAYEMFGIKQYVYAKSNDLSKFYVLERNNNSCLYEFKEVGTVEDIDFKIPLLEELGENYETSPKLFNDSSKPTNQRVELNFVLVLERQIPCYPGEGNEANQLYMHEVSGKVVASSSVSVKLQDNWNTIKFVGDEVISLEAGQDKVLPKELVQEVLANRIAYKFKSITNSVLVEGFKTIQEEIMEPKQFPVKIEIRTPKMIEKEVPKKIMVEKPKKKIIQVPRMIEKEVPKKVENVTYEPSTMYPIMEIRAKYQGEYYNNLGFSIGTSFLDKFNNELASSTKMFPYSLSLWTRKSVKHAPEYNKTLDGEVEMEFLFTDKAIRDPKTDGLVDFNNIYKNNWYNETSFVRDYRPFEFEYFKIYEDNFNKLLKDFAKSEKEVISVLPKQYKDGLASNNEWYDFVDEDIEEQFKLINPFVCKTSKNVRLQTVVLSDERPVLKEGQKEVNMSSDKPIFLDGGSDGTFTNEEYERLFQTEIDKYDDLNSEVQSLAVNKESTLWDSGFTLETKKYFPKFISKRKDTWIMLSTHDATLGKKYFNISQSKAIAASLNTALKLAPESTFYGTGVARGQIIMGAGIPEDGTTDEYVALTYEILLMMSRFAGSSTGNWKREFLYDKMPNNIIRQLKDIQPNFIPEGSKAALWETNLVYAQNSDRNEYFFPAQQTVYNNDTSVLNNSFAMIALATSVKVSFEVWQEYTGDTELTPVEFKAAIENRLTEKLTGRFANLIDVEVECIIDTNDALRGYSWKNVIRLYGNVMKTVCVHTTEMYRKTA